MTKLTLEESKAGLVLVFILWAHFLCILTFGGGALCTLFSFDGRVQDCILDVERIAGEGVSQVEARLQASLDRRVLVKGVAGAEDRLLVLEGL